MRTESIVLDATLLVVLVVGTASLGFLGKHKNARTYSRADFFLLVEIVSGAGNTLTTPNILTETSNLARQFGEPARGRITKLLGDMIQPMEEIYVESRNAARRPEFMRLGLTDCALLDALRPTHTLLTADFGLYRAALERGLDAENFNHLREQRLK
jgi:hypothetical protein